MKNVILSDDNVKEFEYGYFSNAQWEEYSQYVIYKNFNLIDAKTRFGYSAEREVKEHFQSKDDPLKTYLGRIDLVLRKYAEKSQKYQTAIELKVETRKDDDSNADRFSSTTINAALQGDYKKLEKRFVTKDKEKYDKGGRWAVVIARSPKEIAKLDKVVKKESYYKPKTGADEQCFTYYKHKGYAVALVEKKIGKCHDLGSQPYVVSGGDTAVTEDWCASSDKEKKDFKSDPENSFFQILIDNSPGLKLAPLRGKESSSEEVAWELPAQVMISKGLQCDTTGITRSTQVREINYPGLTSILDFLVGFEEIEYAIELKVDVNNQFGGEFANFALALKKEADKLKTWKSTDKKKTARWVVGIMRSDGRRCTEIAGQFKKDRKEVCPDLGSGLHLTRDSSDAFYTTETVWTQITSEKLLYVLVCYETGSDDNVCEKPVEPSAKKARKGPK